MDMGHEVAHLCGGPVGVRPYPVFNMGGTFTQYARAPFVHHRVARDWDLLVDTENGLPYFSPLWRSKPILACVYHVHSEQWGQRFPPPLATVGRFAEAKIMPLVYRRVPFVAISSSTASALEDIGIERNRIHVLHSGVDSPSVGRRRAVSRSRSSSVRDDSCPTSGSTCSFECGIRCDPWSVAPSS